MISCKHLLFSGHPMKSIIVVSKEQRVFENIRSCLAEEYEVAWASDNGSWTNIKVGSVIGGRSEEKPKRATIVDNILKKPERLIGTILLGNNLANVAMTALATALAISFWGQRGLVTLEDIIEELVGSIRDEHD